MSILSRKKWKALSSKKNLSGQEALEAVKQNGGALSYVTNQTEAICLEAVKQNGYALRYVANQTEAICLEAVKQDGDALCYVEERFLDKESCDGEILTYKGREYRLTEV